MPGGGGDDGCPGVDCDTIDTLFPSAGDGVYWIDPLGSGIAYETFCDQTLDGGGWTLVANIDDVNDPYFGGHAAPFYGAAFLDAWETDSTRNPTQIGNYTTALVVSAKYRSFSEIPVSDVKIMYLAGTAPGQQINAPYFVGLGLSGNATLDAHFAIAPPGRGTCTALFTSFNQDRLVGGTSAPFGLNCSDSNEDWFNVSPTAENARIGGQDADFSLSMNAWLGALGDRGFSTSLYEKTWGEFSVGSAADRDILLFVR